MSRLVVVFSGGLDSTVLLHHLADEGHSLVALSADYGQRHWERERRAGEAVCRRLSVQRRVVELQSLAECFGPNSLTDARLNIPLGEYDHETIGLTTVPNRNMILVSVGLALAASLRFDGAAFGAHAGIRANYPDCRPEFAAALDAAARVCHEPPLRVVAPFVSLRKSDVVRRGAELGVPFDLTWSCYEGAERHCGRCGTCVDRRAAFRESGVADPTSYGEG